VIRRRFFFLLTFAAVCLEHTHLRSSAAGRGPPFLIEGTCLNGSSIRLRPRLLHLRAHQIPVHGYEQSSYAWWTDWPDADVNFSWRLHQMTAMQVDPEGKVIELTDKALFDLPIRFHERSTGIVLSEEEVKALRKYLLNGGFMMVDDFWGEANWQHFYEKSSNVFFPIASRKNCRWNTRFFITSLSSGETADTECWPCAAVSRHGYHVGSGRRQDSALSRNLRRS
jgi:hypothetical protein